MLNRRRDPLPKCTDTVIVQQDTEQYTFVNRDGTIADSGADAFGITMESASGDREDPVLVTRMGFCPVIVITASEVADEKVPLTVGANGKAQGVPGSGGGTAVVVGLSEEAAPADNGQTGAYIDCLSHGRSVDVPT